MKKKPLSNIFPDEKERRPIRLYLNFAEIYIIIRALTMFLSACKDADKEKLSRGFVLPKYIKRYGIWTQNVEDLLNKVSQKKIDSQEAKQ